VLTRVLLCCCLLAALPVWADDPSVLLAALGDVMCARTVPARVTAHGPAWVWEPLAPYLARADLRFCNLECPATDGGRAIPKRYSFRADPAQMHAVLAAGKIDVVALANNHTFDYGRSGLAQTMATMRAAGILAPGAGLGRAAAVAPRLLTVHGLTLAFLAYTSWTPEGYTPSEDGACLATLDETTLAQEIRSAKAHADLVILSVHWGKEYAPVPTPYQRDVAHLAIESGADLILGHHPHVTQPLEIYHDRPIFYSLGNALFDRSDARYSNGLLALVRLTRGTVTVERQVPFRLEDARAVLLAP
jgi:poly-gamma-glutamate synthesis protein (capsule biosynthesis protein)